MRHDCCVVLAVVFRDVRPDAVLADELVGAAAGRVPQPMGMVVEVVAEQATVLVTANRLLQGMERISCVPYSA